MEHFPLFWDLNSPAPSAGVRTHYLNKMAINFSRCKLTIVAGRVVQGLGAGEGATGGARQLLTATGGLPLQHPLAQPWPAINVH